MSTDRLVEGDGFFTIDVSDLAAEVQERLRAECEVFNSLSAVELIEWTSLESFEEMQDWMTRRINS